MGGGERPSEVVYGVWDEKHMVGKEVETDISHESGFHGPDLDES